MAVDDMTSLLDVSFVDEPLLKIWTDNNAKLIDQYFRAFSQANTPSFEHLYSCFIISSGIYRHEHHERGAQERSRMLPNTKKELEVKEAAMDDETMEAKKKSTVSLHTEWQRSIEKTRRR